jgi:hypothetical protein
MRKYAWPWACVALLVAAAVAGCGGGGNSTSVPTSTAATAPAPTTSSTTPGQATADDVYKSCLDALGTAVSQSKGQRACAQVRDTFQQCTTAATNAPEGSARDAALKACQQAADQATAQFQASP